MSTRRPTIFRLAALSTAVAAAGVIGGCTKYYEVSDPTGGKTYLTSDIDKGREAGAVRFKDAKTGAEVTLQSSEVKEISKQQFEAGVGKKK